MNKKLILSGVLICCTYYSLNIVLGNFLMHYAQDFIIIEYEQLPYLRIASIVISLLTSIFLLEKVEPTKLLNTLFWIVLPLLILSCFSGNYFNKIIQWVPGNPDPADKEFWEEMFREKRRKFRETWRITNVFEYFVLAISGVIWYKKRK